MANKESVSTFININGSLDQRIQGSTSCRNANELSRKMDTKPTKQNIDILVPNICNQKCNHCFFVEQGKQDLRIDTESFQEIRTLLDYFKARDDRINLWLYPKEITTALQLLPFYHELDMDKILTNASYITESTPQILKANGIRRAAVSIHGSIEHHLELTGISEEAYSKTIKGIQILQESGIPVSTFTTVYGDNVHDIPDLIDEAYNLGVRDMKFVRYTPDGRAKQLPSDKLLSIEHVIEFLVYINKSRIKHPNMNLRLFGLSFGPNFYSNKYFKYLSGESGMRPNTKYFCPWIDQQYLGISLGTHDIYPCFLAMSFPQLKSGHVDISLGNVDVKILTPQVTEQNLTTNLQGQCSRDNCEYQSLCMGGCRNAAFSISESKGETNPLFAGQEICLTRIIDQLA